jgi:hypothetical protein
MREWSTGGMIIVSGESMKLGKSLLQCHIIHHKSIWTAMGMNPGLHSEKPETTSLIYGMASYSLQFNVLSLKTKNDDVVKKYRTM